ncbi:MAG: carboxymuconolactone decarboxylase family protein [Pseudonocardiales bacterium]|nr:carboxymuconolactone decarboxylase family protein [Pseudonocardiales bacterium]
MAARIAPLPSTGNPPDIQELLDFGTEATGGASNVFLTLAKNPQLFRRWLPFYAEFYTPGRLAPRQRELLILRTAWQCRCDYEWGAHVRMGRAAGLTDEEIAGVADHLNAQAWSPTDEALLRVVDELIDDHTVEQPTWDALTRHFDEPQLIEVLMVVGSYVGLAGFLNAVEVQREAGVPGLPQTPKEDQQCLA